MGNGTHKALKRIEQVSLRNGDIRHSRTNVRPMAKYTVKKAGYAQTSDKSTLVRVSSRARNEASFLMKNSQRLTPKVLSMRTVKNTYQIELECEALMLFEQQKPLRAEPALMSSKSRMKALGLEELR